MYCSHLHSLSWLSSRAQIPCQDFPTQPHRIHLHVCDTNTDTNTDTNANTDANADANANPFTCGRGKRTPVRLSVRSHTPLRRTPPDTHHTPTHALHALCAMHAIRGTGGSPRHTSLRFPALTSPCSLVHLFTCSLHFASHFVTP